MTTHLTWWSASPDRWSSSPDYTVGQLILKNHSFRISNSLLEFVLVNELLSVEQRIRIHNWKHSQLNPEFYQKIFNSLGGSYEKINTPGKRPLLPDTEYNYKLSEILKSKDIISDFSQEAKGIRIITFRGSNEVTIDSDNS